jgi:hypothetical protein
MNMGDLDRIEASLSVALPARYRTTMLAYPFPPDHEAAQYCMPDDADLVIEHNSIRPGPPDARWPSEFVVIGTDGSEELYVLDGRSDAAPVLVFDLEASEFRPLASDFDAWLAQLRAWQNDLDEDRDRMRRRYEERRWWQFWIGPPPEQ